jgi:phage terminase Nu1 subunit (DNA packaging protein)
LTIRKFWSKIENTRKFLKVEVIIMSTLLTEKQLREVLQVSRPFLQSCRKEGMPIIPLSGKHFRYDCDEVIDWLKENRGKEQNT